MKRTELRRKLAAYLLTGPEAESATQRAHGADSWDDRVSEDIFDVEEDDAEVASIVQNLKHDLH